MSLASRPIDRLFDRLVVTYGRGFLSLYGGQDIATVKSSWAHELAGFEGRLEPIAWALENLPERCPNVIEFRRLCRSAPAPMLPALPDSVADKARVDATLARLADIKAQVLGPIPDNPRAWAINLQGRIDRGEIKPTYVQRRICEEALASSRLYQATEPAAAAETPA